MTTVATVALTPAEARELGFVYNALHIKGQGNAYDQEAQALLAIQRRAPATDPVDVRLTADLLPSVIELLDQQLKSPTATDGCVRWHIPIVAALATKCKAALALAAA